MLATEGKYARISGRDSGDLMVQVDPYLVFVEVVGEDGSAHSVVLTRRAAKEIFLRAADLIDEGEE